ncbi:glycoside hydrolase family 15 protein [Salinarimonas ramus]|uniref:Glucoamylase n=1 Tax=Salinarimonas ramus TaxID=690164 RepID=A0A917QGT0_9HYPH|nr:glycoside hydrolase family 15 protein [Salinarimonas ramus]GGK48377.1 glucoamylase [Salinarimonas ramus]
MPPESRPVEPPPYVQPPIEDYAIIGDCHGAALVSRAGAIDWLALLRFDDDPTFFRLLDGGERGDLGGGAWEILPDGVKEVHRAYLDRTNVLHTTFVCETGVLEVTDFMPVGRTREAAVHDYVDLNAPGWLVRRLACTKGRVAVTSRFSPRGPGFSKEALNMVVEDGRIALRGGLMLWCGGEIEMREGTALVRHEIAEGESVPTVLTHVMPLFDPRERVEELVAVTCAFWREWAAYTRYRGPYAEQVVRSALALKCLTYAPTGALVAAATTSLPEELGGSRNWDYRFSWLRDSCFALFSLSALGYSGEAARFSEFLTRRCLREGSTMRIVYGIDGQPFLPEVTRGDLAGYRGAGPVRTGNEAAEQRQLDVFGEVLDWADLRHALGADLGPDEKALMASIADHVCLTWELPDQGLWEMRSGPQDFVQGKAMAWVTLDRAAKLLGDRPLWAENRDLILDAIREKGTAGDPPYLTQSFGNEAVDAALLQVPLLGLPLDPALFEETVRRIEADLKVGDLVFRYKGEDGLTGGEGAFMITSFWLVEAYLTVGRGDEARALFESLLARANDVGLYAEEIDPKTGGFLGNFPQAFTHLSLISSAALLHLYEIGGAEAIRGTNADRARSLVGATQGVKALLYALARNRSVKLFSSKASVLALG